MANNEKIARPWDLFRKNLSKLEEDLAQQRLSICMTCPEFIKLTSQCKQCGCFMKSKVKLPSSVCPLNKWSKISVSYKEKEENNE